MLLSHFTRDPHSREGLGMTNSEPLSRTRVFPFSPSGLAALECKLCLQPVMVTRWPKPSQELYPVLTASSQTQGTGPSFLDKPFPGALMNSFGALLARPKTLAPLKLALVRAMGLSKLSDPNQNSAPERGWDCHP